jgi:hypothetical protein
MNKMFLAYKNRLTASRSAGVVSRVHSRVQ